MGFAPVETVKNSEEWITAAEALRLLKPVFDSENTAKLTICRRAHAGLISARAEHFMRDDRSTRDQEVPKEFWWAEGHRALDQNWTTGDFETWIKSTTRLSITVVSFCWRICLISESMGHHDLEIMDDGSID